jgi:hypothetical protein
MRPVETSNFNPNSSSYRKIASFRSWEAFCEQITENNNKLTMVGPLAILHVTFFRIARNFHQFENLKEAKMAVFHYFCQL